MSIHIPIIGLAGTNGAGKDLIGSLLAQHYGYWFYSMSDLLRAECLRRGLPVERQYLRSISAQWRRESGLGTLIDRSVAEFKSLPNAQAYAGAVVGSLRNPAEVDRIHELGGIVLWVDADPRIRYNRIQANAANRGRSGEDNVSYDDFLAADDAEMNPASNADDAVLNMAAVKQKADITILNNTDSPQTLQRDVAAALQI